MSAMCNTENFVGSPLVAWVQAFFIEKIQTNAQLVDDCLISDILNNIDSSVFAALRIQKNDVGDIITRAQNLAKVLRSMKSFYQNKLLQLVVMRTPDVLSIAREPESEHGILEMQKILLLLLGCAVQCDHKEDFIEGMKELDVDVQRGLVTYIQEITEGPDYVISLRQDDMMELSHEELVSLSENLSCQVQKAIEQRDASVEAILDLSLMQAESILDQESAARLDPLKQHSVFWSTGFLFANKQRVAELQNELDDRNMAICDLRDELTQLKLMLDGVRLENKLLVNDAGWAKTYRDEIDILKAKVDEASKLHFENSRLKEKIRELDFYKKRFDELKEQSELLYETKLAFDEMQAAESTPKRAKHEYHEDEKRRLSTDITILLEERNEDQKRIARLLDEVAKLTVEKQSSLSENAVINAELDVLRLQRETESPSVPLLQEYNSASSTELFRLEKENRHLTKLLDTNRSPRIAADVNQDLLEANKRLEERNLVYKSFISKLTKVGCAIFVVVISSLIIALIVVRTN